MTITPRPGGPIAHLGAQTTCGYCGCQVRHRHGVPFQTAEGGAWHIDPETGAFHRPGVGRGTWAVHRCGTPPLVAPLEPVQLQLGVEP